MKIRMLAAGVFLGFALACGGGGADVGGGSLPSGFEDIQSAIGSGEIGITSDFGGSKTALINYPASEDVVALGGKYRDAAKAGGWTEIAYSDAGGAVGGTFEKGSERLVFGIANMGQITVSLTLSPK